MWKKTRDLNTHWLASGMSLEKIERKVPRQLSWGIPDSIWIMLDRLPLKKHPMYSVRQVTLHPQCGRVCKAITHMFFQQQTMIDNVKSHTEV
jgi:hypothetical protein